MTGRAGLTLAAATLCLGTGGAWAQPATEAQPVAPLRAHRCMAVSDDPRTGTMPAVLAGPRPAAASLGPAIDTVIVPHPLRVVNGFAQLLLRDGRTGWVRRARLRRWAVAASPRLRCVPFTLSDGLPGVVFAHPG